MQVFISICIPAYKNTLYLQRVLDSIKEQTFRDYEVIITDDSPDDSVALLTEKYKQAFPLRYFRNQPALGSPANWNAAMKLATGQWIKMMHDDDWFAAEDSLQHFASAARQTNSEFIYSGYIKVDTEKKQQKTVLPAKRQIQPLRDNPEYIIAQNVIGHPSTTMVKNTGMFLYDEQLKWLVDVEYYYRLLSTHSFSPISLPLVCIGINDEQITKTAFRNPAIEIPENLYVLNKVGTKSMRSMLVYDYFWRFIRNLHIGDIDVLEQNRQSNAIPPVIKSIVFIQQRIPRKLLQTGYFSKLFMCCAYLYHRTSGNI